MAQWFIDTASISNLEITRSYIGSGSTSFNKENSFLRVNNGVRQGINNSPFGTFGTNNNSISHIEGYNNLDVPGTCHIEGANNTTVANSNVGHVEGANNSGKIYFSHMEGANNSIFDSTSSPDANLTANHIEGGFNTGSAMGWGNSHIEGYNHLFKVGSVQYNHLEGANNLIGSGSVTTFRWSHIEGYNNNIQANTYYTHLEGTDHTTKGIQYGWGRQSHIEGRNNQLTLSNLNSYANHIEGSNNIISSSDTGVEVNATHVCGISCSSYFNNIYSFMSGLGSQTYYPNSTSHISGQFNTSNVSSYTNISSTKNKIYYSFTIGGGINNSTRKNIFEVTLISSASNVINFPTRSIILPWVSESGEFASDLLAAAGGVPLGGFYRTGNDLKIRLS